MHAFATPETFASTFDLVGDSILIASADGRIVYVNPAFENLTGYKREEAVGRPCNLLKSGSHPRQLYDDLWSTLRAKKPFRTIFTNRRKNGDLYEEGLIISPILGSDGEVEYYLSIGREINALRQTFDAFLVLANNSPSGVYLVRNGRIVYVNQEVATYAGTTMQDMIDRTWEEFVAPEDQDRVRAELREMLDGARERPIEYRLQRRDGEIRWVMQSVRPIQFREARFAGMEVICGNLVDITDRFTAEQRLQGALSMQQATVEATTDGILVTGGEGHLVSSNKRFRELWSLQHFVTPEAGLDAIYQAMQAQMVEPSVLIETIRRLSASPDATESLTVELLDGRVLELFSNAFVVEGARQGRVWSWRDVTERKRFEMALLQLANHDPLTGLINRRRLQELVQESLAGTEQPTAALLMLDLDRFKEINDSLGHQAGDEVLIRVGATLRKTLAGQYVARFGGDEFAVYMPSATVASARQAAADIITAIESASYSAGGIEVPVTASIGIAIAPQHGRAPDQLLANADIAMYAAKAAGRNRYRVYSHTLHQRKSLETRRQLQADLHEAIQVGRWRLFTRPALCLTNTGPTIHRLQPRFLRPDGTTLPDSEELGLDEQAGVLRRVNVSAIDEAGRLLSTMYERGERAVSLLLPWLALTDRDTVEALRKAMSRVTAADASIFLELTGVNTLQDAREISKTMTALRDQGYRFILRAPDGALVPKVVQELPVDLLRVHQCLVDEAAGNRFSLELLTSLIRALHGIGVGTIADAVNSRSTLDTLREAGMDYVRGNYIGRHKLTSTFLRQLQSPPKAA